MNAIDRDALEEALDDLLEEGEGTVAVGRLKKLADRILALVQPDVSTEPEPGPNMETRARLRDSGGSEPEADDTRDATARPHLSRTDIHGAGQVDRDALVGLLLDYLRGTTVPALPLAAKILALVQPTEGVHLTPEEVRVALDWWNHSDRYSEEGAALSDRLEASA